MYLLGAQFTLILHFLFIVFVCFGAYLVAFRPYLVFFHIPSVVWGVYLEFTSSKCPLTYLENYFLKKANLNSYPEGFLQKYIFNTIYPINLNAEIQSFLAIILIVVNIILYYMVINKMTKS